MAEELKTKRRSAQQRANVARPIASDLSASDRRARRKEALGSRILTKEQKKRKAELAKLLREAPPAGQVSEDKSLIKRIQDRKDRIEKELNAIP